MILLSTPFITCQHVNPRFTRLNLLSAPPSTNLVGVPALTPWYCRLRLAVALHHRISNPFPVVGLLVSARGSSCHHYANPCSVARAIPRWSIPLDDVDLRPTKRIRSSGPFGKGNTVPGGWICTRNVTLDFIGGTDTTLLQHTPLPWLKELHSRIWKQEKRRSTLFRTKVVTRAHYDALQIA
jgi:hypothetical protein